jgi:hypothetical protein
MYILQEEIHSTDLTPVKVAYLLQRQQKEHILLNNNTECPRVLENFFMPSYTQH